MDTMDALCLVEVLATTRHLRAVQLRAMRTTPDVLLGVGGAFCRNDSLASGLAPDGSLSAPAFRSTL